MPDDEKCCSCCGEEYEPMGVEITEVLHLIPAILVVLQFIRRRYKKKCDCGEEKFVIAEMPERQNDKSAVTMELIAAMLVSKFCDHSPIHRQMNRLLKDYRYSISEGSFCRWRDEVGEILLPFADFIKERILKSRCINTDATTAKYRLPKEGHCLVNGNEYVYIGNDNQPYNYYDFQRNQSQKGILELLYVYSGYVQRDAHSNYAKLFSPSVIDESRPPPLEVGCHAHARRKFKDIEKLYPEQEKPMLCLWQKLYKIEKEMKNRPDEECLFRRREESVPLLNQLFDGCREVQL